LCQTIPPAAAPSTSATITHIHRELGAAGSGPAAGIVANLSWQLGHVTTLPGAGAWDILSAARH